MTLGKIATPPWDCTPPQEGAPEGGCFHPVPTRFQFSLPGWHVWCGSVVENPGGTYSLFFSCWPEKCGHEGWVTHSQIWRAEGAEPWGPFLNPEVIFSVSTLRSWDADNFHNVTVKAMGGRFYMYYTGNFGDGKWWVHRNNQRIGVAVADSPAGPWRRLGTPLLNVSEDSWDSLCVANPSVTPTSDGRVMMIYKGVTAGDLPFGSQVLHGVAFAESPEGPFVKVREPLFQIPGSRFPFEDPHIWRANGRYRCLMKDMVGLPGSCPRATLLFESEDGMQWPTNDYRVVATPHLLGPGGEVTKVERLERPAYFSSTKNPCLSFAVKPEGDAPSFLVFAPGRVSERARSPGEALTSPSK